MLYSTISVPRHCWVILNAIFTLLPFSIIPSCFNRSLIPSVLISSKKIIVPKVLRRKKRKNNNNNNNNNSRSGKRQFQIYKSSQDFFLSCPILLCIVLYVQLYILNAKKCYRLNRFNNQEAVQAKTIKNIIVCIRQCVTRV